MNVNFPPGFSKNVILVLVVILFSSLTVFSQLPKVVPLSPNAAALVKSGDYKVGPITGRPAINFPIYTVESGSLKIPISLGYDASGVQVNQLATWVGLGWSLNIGNMITRTVRGLPDELAVYGWMDDPTSATDIANSSDYETQRRYADLIWDPSPDFFNYSLPGKSGKFIFRKTSQKFETIPFEPIDVVYQNGSGAGNYQITDNDGTKYYFEYKKTYTNLGDPVGTPGGLARYTESWYLTKMISANNTDTISLTYQLKATGATDVPMQPEWLMQKQYQRIYSLNNGGTYNNEGVTETISLNTGLEPVLTEIKFRGGKVIFHSNTARKDYPAPMLDSIVVLNKESIVQKFRFNYEYFTTDQPQWQYDYRLKLRSFGKTEVKNGLDSETHSFEYNEEVNLPSTSSTAQDYWGYYNGRDQGFLMNKPPTDPELFNPYVVNNIWVGIADRSVSEGHVKAGTLSKITYPTKGFSVFDFESNKYKSEYTSNGESTIASARVTGTAKNKPVTKTVEFIWGTNYLNNAAALRIYFSANKGPGPFVLEDVQKVQFFDITDGTHIGTWSHVNNIYSPEEKNFVFYLTPGHTYRIISSVQDEASELNPTYLTMSLSATIVTTQSLIKSGGGLRISAIRNYDPGNQLLSTEKYSYQTGNGAGVGMYLRTDEIFERNSFTRKTWVVDEECEKTMEPCRCLRNYKTEIIYMGVGNYPQITLEGATVVYGGVTKTIYDQNGDINGKAVYSQTLNFSSNSIYNPNVPGRREYINNTITPGGMPSEQYYSYNKLTNQYILVKEKLFDYGLKHIDSEPITAVYRIMFYPPKCPTPPTVSTSDFTHMQYSLKLGVYKLNSSTERDYDVMGNLIADNTTSYYYDNSNHMEVTRVEKTGSNQSILKDVIKYPDDFTDNSYGSNLLRAKSIRTFPMETITFRNNNQLKKQTNTYQEYTGKVWLGTVETSMGNSQPDILRYEKYDPFGNALQIQRPGSATSIVKHSYIWGYNSLYPIAETKNAAYSDIYFTGFEDGDGNTAADDSYTGKFSRSGGFAKALSGLTDGNYMLSYWNKSLDNWILQTQSIQVSGGSYTINISGQIDDVRFYPKDAEMSTYTYNPLVGMTSQTDPKGLTTYFEYDGLQRLKHVKDQNRNIVKSNDYHYKP